MRNAYVQFYFFHETGNSHNVEAADYIRVLALWNAVIDQSTELSKLFFMKVISKWKRLNIKFQIRFSKNLRRFYMEVFNLVIELEELV